MIAGLAVGVAALIAGSSASAATIPSPPSAVGYLFSIPTAAGSLRGPNDQHLTLSLIGTRDYLTRFTDRPLREAYVLADGTFVKRFRGFFGAVKPNAVLTYTPPGSAIPVSIVLTVGQPRWNASRATWTFPATRIRKQPDDLPGARVQIKPTLVPNPRSFKQATLFIDDSGPVVVQGCLFAPGAICVDSQMQLSDLRGVDASNGDFTGSSFTGSNFTGANLTSASFHDADLSGSTLSDANLTNADLSDAVLDFDSLFGANLQDADLSHVDLAGADLSHANLTGADVTGTNLTVAGFCDTTMPNGSVYSTRC